MASCSLVRWPPLLLFFLVFFVSLFPPVFSSSPVASFLAWSSGRDLFISPNVSLAPAHGGLGIFASTALAKGVRVLSVPFNSLINIEHAVRSAVIGPLIAELPETDAMAAFIAFSRKPSDSPPSQDPATWRPYWKLLEPPDTPLFFSSDLLLELSHTAVAHYAERRNARVSKQYAGLSEDLRSLISEQEFREGLSLLWSRTFAVSVRDNRVSADAPPEKRWVKAGCLVPGADLLNSGPKEDLNVECKTNAESTHFECFTSVSIASGSELLAPYGSNLHNAQLLHDYGFTYLNNSNDLVEVRFPIVTSSTGRLDPLFDRQLQILHAMEKYEDARFHLKYPSDIKGFVSDCLPADLWAYARVATMNDEDLKQFDAQEMFDRLKRNDHFNDANDLRTVKYLIQYIAYWLEQYPSSLDQDIILYQITTRQGHGKGAPFDRRLAGALAVRIGEKKILHRILEILWQFRQMLEKEAAEGFSSEAESLQREADEILQRSSPPKLGMLHNTPNWEDFQDEL